LQCVGFISCVHLLRNEKEEGRKKLIYRWGGRSCFSIERDEPTREFFNYTQTRTEKEEEERPGSSNR
jgi:hypothetical protein